MKLITRDTDYAMRALCYIAAQEDEVIDADNLVKKLRIPRAFLRKLLQVLTREGYLKSYKGQGGGFSLKIPPSKIYLVDLMEIFQGPFKLDHCFVGKKACPDRAVCCLRKKIKRIELRLWQELKPINAGELLRLIRARSKHGKKKDYKDR